MSIASAVDQFDVPIGSKEYERAEDAHVVINHFWAAYLMWFVRDV